jgi:hypothetical protein
VELLPAVKFKCCNKCCETLPTTAFPPKKGTKDGLYGFCRPCKNQADRDSRKNHALSKSPVDKKCTRCGEIKSPIQFGKNKSRSDGLHDACKICKSEMAKALYNKDKPRILSTNKLWRDANKDKVLKISQNYYESNKQDFIVRSATRRAKKLQATLPLTKEQEQQIQDFYWLAKDLTAVSGETYHVDHIVPLQGKNVCGLHVPWNLQVLPADINLSKGNRYADDA